MSLRMVLPVLLVACDSPASSGVDAPPPADRATGEVGAWQAGPALPTPRANHCAAAIDDWVLVIGGNHAAGTGFVKTDEIHAAKLAADGTLGPWQLAGHTPSPVSECTATTDGRHLYVIDGLYDVATDAGKIWTAELDATGHLGALASIGALPTGVIAISSEATVHAGTLLLMDTRVPADGDATVTLRTPLANMAWTTDDWKIGFRAQAQYAFTDSFAVTLGGYHDPAIGAIADVFVAPIGTGGAVGTPVAATPLPAATAFGEAIAVDDWIFVTGGRAQVFGAGGTTNVFGSKIGAGGALGPWLSPTPLPVPRTNHAMVLVGDFLVIAGGANTGPGDATVLVARVRY